MLNFFGSLRPLLKLEEVCIDNIIFQMHYKATVFILLIFSLLVTSKQYFGDPIYCQPNDAVDENVLTTYCWIHSTFAVTRLFSEFRPGITAAHPGVGTLGENDPVLHYKYYQWVAFMLFFQAMLFYAPRYIWKAWEGDRLKLLAHGMGGPLTDETSLTAHKRRILNFFGAYTSCTNNLYAVRYVVCEGLNFVNVVGQFYILDMFLNGQFMRYGLEVLAYVQDPREEERVDPMATLFPTVTKCSFRNFGPSGNIQHHDTLCILPLNVVNGKIFLFLWFWFVALAVLTALTLAYRIVLYLVPEARTFTLRTHVPSVHRGRIQYLVQHRSFGDWFFLCQLGRNINPIIFRELILDLSAQSVKSPTRV